MKNNFEKILNKAGEIKLTKSEKESLRSALLSEMESSVLPREKSLVLSNYSWFVFLSRHTTAAFILLIIFVGSGASAVAQGSLPGEFLYGVKTSLNENVSGWFMKPIKGEAEWQLELAERRLIEADLLVKENKLTQERKNILKRKFDEHAERVESFIPADSSQENFRAVVETGLSVETVEPDMLSVRSPETSLVEIPVEKAFSAKILEAQSLERDFKIEKEEALSRAEEVSRLIKERNLSKEQSIQARFKLLKAREVLSSLSLNGSEDRELVEKALSLIETAESLVESDLSSKEIQLGL